MIHGWIFKNPSSKERIPNVCHPQKGLSAVVKKGVE